ncbi:Endonuclease/exonuclease/phosphatase [Trinorchestia longiramus]|nr:Endonuclease/exonuclease/phosphatase [Trinorchestia longiramus]
MSQTTCNLLRINHHTELQSFKIETGTNKDITIINAYIPPDTSPTLPAGYKPNLQALNIHRNTILCGDFNAKHSSWFTQQQNNTRGEELSGQLNSLFILNDTNKPTHIPPQIKKIYNTKLHNIKRWLANYLSGRQAYVHCSGKSSKTLNIPNGVPQGSVLSPTLFNLYMHDIPPPPENVHVASYANDITTTSTYGNLSTCSTQVQDYMDTITA